MTRPARYRFAALLLAAAFLQAGAERAFSYANCPHHGAPTEAGAAHAGHHDGSAPADHSGSGPCSCLGECQAAGGFVPAGGSIDFVVAIPFEHAAAAPLASAPLLRLAPHTLPFATAPPRDC